MGSSGNSSSTSLTIQLFRGGLTRPLKRKVPYTKSTKPSTCNHLNVSQPKKREAIQMKSVRQVSIVDRDVALTLLVTESPKKLKPLTPVVSLTPDRERKELNIPNANHDQNARNLNPGILSDLSPSLYQIKISISPGLSSPYSQM